MEPGFTIEDARCVNETAKAIQVVAADVSEYAFWVPKSQITDDSEVYKEDTEGELIVTEWLAAQKGWL